MRLRWRMNDGKLSLWFSCDNMEDIERQAFDRCVDAFQVELPELPVYRVR